MAEQESSGQKEVQLFEPTYQLGPEEKERFRPAAVKKIAEQVLKEHLADVKEYVILATRISVNLSFQRLCLY